MRRPPEVAQAALYLGLLLGISGCAGFPQRTTGGSPWANGADSDSPSPPGLFSWWHRSGVQTTGATSGPAENSATVAPSQPYASTTNTATSPWPETQSEWVARNFPRFNRFWNGTPAARPAGSAEGSAVTWTNRIPAQSSPDEVAAAADSPRSDGAVRPTDGPSDRQGDPETGRAASPTQSLNNLPFSPTPPGVKSPRETAQAPAAPPGSEDDPPIPARIDSTDSSETDGAARTSFEPVNDGSPTVAKTGPAAASDTTARQSPPQPAASSVIEPAPLLAAPTDLAAPGAGSSPTTNASASSASPPLQPANSDAAASLDTRLAQVPPAPPPIQRTPPSPPPSGESKPATPPPAPPASATPAQTTPATPAQTTPAQATPAQTTPATPAPPAPTAAQTQPSASVSGQRPFAASRQSVYASPPPMAPEQPRHHLFGRLFHDDDGAPVASAQGAPAAFPTMFSSPQNALPKGQGTAADCSRTACATKKPCFLKVWIHDWKANHDSAANDCGHGGTCASAQTNLTACDSDAPAPKKPCFLKVWIHDWKASHGSGASDCGHGGICASPQGNSGVCETAAPAPKKPCFLKVWIHDWKNSHGSGCGGCQNDGGSSCKNCKRCGGGTPVTGSAQGGVAAPQAASPQSGRSS